MFFDVIAINNRTFGSYVATRYAPFFLFMIFSYVPCIYIGQYLMRNRKPYKLKYITILWNALLSILSGTGALIFLMYHPQNIFFSHLDINTIHPKVTVVLTLFLLTKPIEFGDTFLLILKKKKVIFLHSYHHLTVALYCWHAQCVNITCCHSLTFINLAIHCVMYAYYACTTLSPKRPILSAMRPYITMSQTLQMFVGIWMSIQALSDGPYEPGLWYNVLAAALMYVSYAYLFALFYLQNYRRNIRSHMALVIGTVYVGAFVGAWKAWKHPNFQALFYEMLLGFLYSAIVYSYFCLPPEIHLAFENIQAQIGSLCQSELPVMIDSDNAKPTTPAVKDILHNSKIDAARSAEVPSSIISEISHSLEIPSKCQEVLARPEKNSSNKFPSKKIVSSAANLEKVAGADSPHYSPPYALIEYIKSFKNQKELAPYLLRLRNRSRLTRILLVIQNPWITWASEYQFFKKLAVKPEKLQTHSSLMDSLLHETELQLELQQVFTFLNQQSGLFLSNEVLDCIFVSLSMISAASTGYLLHGDWLLGLLVHGCLRWVFELHAVGALLNNELIVPEYNNIEIPVS